MRILAILCLYSCQSWAELYHFVSINNLIEQEVGRIVAPKIFDRLDIAITITPVPAKRAEYEATRGLSDGEIMRIFSYGNDNPDVIRVPTSYYSLKTMIFIRKHSNISINSQQDLSNYKIARVRGVKHTDNVTQGLSNIVDLNSTKQIIRFLDKGRADLALTNGIDGLMAISELAVENIEMLPTPLQELDLYFYLNKKHQALVPRLDRIIIEMQQSGELARIVRDAESAVIEKPVIELLPAKSQR